MAANRRFAELIEAWQLRLAVLHQMVDPVEPPAQLWPRIRAAVGLAAEAAPAHAAAASWAGAAHAQTAPAPHGGDIVIPPPGLENHSADRTATIAPVFAMPGTPQKPNGTPAGLRHHAAQDEAEIDTPPPLPSPQPAPATNGSGLSPESMRVVRFAWQARRWKWTATGVSAIAASLLVIIVAQLYRPDMLPEALRPAVRTQIVRVVTPPPPMPAQYVALLQKDAASPAFILTVDAGSKKFSVRKVGAADEAGRSYELWLVSDKLQRPRSLGVIGERDFTTRGALASFDDDTMHEATYAVTVEPEGGSPTGVATGPVVFTGKLVETVPQGSFGK